MHVGGFHAVSPFQLLQTWRFIVVILVMASCYESTESLSAVSDKQLLDCPKDIWSVLEGADPASVPSNITVQRDFNTAFEAELITKAERVPPSRDALLTLLDLSYQEELDRCPKAAEDSSLLREESQNLWYYDRFDCLCIPYAVTCHALAYYRDVVLSANQHDYSPFNGIKMQSVSLRYTAESHFHEHFELDGASFVDVYVVHLNISWSQYCGPTCALLFAKERIVVFDQEGEVEAISGDGEASFVVS